MNPSVHRKTNRKPTLKWLTKIEVEGRVVDTGYLLRHEVAAAHTTLGILVQLQVIDSYAIIPE